MARKVYIFEVLLLLFSHYVFYSCCSRIPLGIQRFSVQKIIDNDLKCKKNCLSNYETSTVVVTCSDKENQTKNKKKVQLINFFAGGLAGTISSTLTIPLEVIKTQIQASTVKETNPLKVAKLVVSKDGTRGLFRGIKPLLFGIIPAR